jgi:hypothetical protein
MLTPIRRYFMAKSSKKAKGPAKSASKKVAIKDLKAKDAGSVKGGVTTMLAEFKVLADKDIKQTVRSFIK